jgi:hypothetical protein
VISKSSRGAVQNRIQELSLSLVPNPIYAVGNAPETYQLQTNPIGDTVMITIVDYKERMNKDGEPFIALVLEGDMELVQSEAGRYYATARRTSIPSSFTEETCKRLIGKQMPGAIVKVECDSYEYTLPETGEIIYLTHRYEYSPHGGSNELAVFSERHDTVYADN